jgi:hypothetical protein
VLLLVRSLREYGGALASSAVEVLAPDDMVLGDEWRDAVIAAGAQVTRLAVPPEIRSFPFAAKVQAAAHVEAMCEERADAHRTTLVWMDADTLVLDEPGALVLGGDEVLAYRPVHHKLIGSAFGEPLDEYWSTVYRLCGVEPGAVFPMTTCADRQAIRPYYNAGLLAVLPAAGLMRRWAEVFEGAYQTPEMRQFYGVDSMYAIFAHQAVLTGVVLSRVARDHARELPERYNYPLHLHSEYASDWRARRLNELATCRYEVLPFGADWWSEIPIDEPLATWLVQEAAHWSDREE